MTSDEAVEALRGIDSEASEEGHAEADSILCDLLESLGYDNVVAEYHLIGKWYS